MVKMIYKGCLLIFFHLLMGVNLFGALRPLGLTCEYKENPIGIEAIQPRFGWWLNAERIGIGQRAYQVQVAETRHDLIGGQSNIWDSKKVISDRNWGITYSGRTLQSTKKYYWRIRIWDEKGKVSEWSEAATFRMGLLSQQDWINASWIAFESMSPETRVVPGIHGNGDGLGDKLLKRAVNPLFRKSFSLQKEISEATVFVSGMGQYELYLNGNKVSNDFLSPGWTNYDKRCLYNTYDVTKQLKKGENVLGSIVGSGFFYLNRERYRKYAGAYGYPMFRMILHIRYTDGSIAQIVTDQSWKTAPSPLNYSSIYGGENYDARLEQVAWNKIGFNESKWKNVVLTTGPEGKMAAQLEYPLRVMDTIKVKKISASVTGNYIYDFGQNASGIISIKVKGKAGDTIRITPSEMLNEKGLVTQVSSGGPYYFEYVLKGNGIEEWTPRFTYYGFRYAMVEGAVPEGTVESNSAKLMAMIFLHTRNSAPRVGSFESSNPLFNRIYDLINWALKSNIASVSTDCPHREKMGWLEQAHLMGESLKYNYDIFHLYNKIVDDIIEAQLPNGMVPSIAPEFVHFSGPFRDDPGYGSAAVVLPWYLYKWYGDKEVLLKSYDMMKRYVAYLETQATTHTLSHGLGDWLDLGPKAPGEAQLTPVGLTATAFYYQNVSLMATMAKILDKEQDVEQYGALAKEIKYAFNKKFFNEETKVYGTGSQTSYSMPLYFGLVADKNDQERVFKNLIDSIMVHDKRITAGDIGHRFLVQTLQKGAPDLLFDIHSQTDKPGYGYQLKNGSTALAEHWSGPSVEWLSQNHMIFGHLMEWFYTGLGGISQQDGDSGFRKLRIDPELTGDITWVKTSYASLNGKIAVNWKRTAKAYVLEATIPFNTMAEIVLPVSQTSGVLVNGKPLTKNIEISGQKIENGKLMIVVSSGKYIFTCPI